MTDFAFHNDEYEGTGCPARQAGYDEYAKTQSETSYVVRDEYDSALVDETDEAHGTVTEEQARDAWFTGVEILEASIEHARERGDEEQAEYLEQELNIALDVAEHFGWTREQDTEPATA